MKDYRNLPMFGHSSLMIWPAFIALTIFSFPLQVYWMSPYPAVLPWIFAALAFARYFFEGRTLSQLSDGIQSDKATSWIIAFYMLLVTLNTGMDFVNEKSDFHQVGSSLLVFAFPVFVLIYFKQIANTIEIRLVLQSIAVCGAIVGAYSCYDLIMKVVLEITPPFAKQSMEYIYYRNGTDEGSANLLRVSIGNRGSGMLESHTVSGAISLFGLFSAVVLTQLSPHYVRVAILVFYGIATISTMNFTAIVGGSLITMLVIYKGVFYAFGKNWNKAFRIIAFGTTIIATPICLSYFYIETTLGAYFIKIFNLQLNYLFGIDSDISPSFGSNIMEPFVGFVEYLASRPAVFVFGEGFSTVSTGWPKGGDVGVVVTISRLGVIPFLGLSLYLIFVVFQCLRAVNSYCSNSKGKSSFEDGSRLFCVSVIIFTMVSDLHYSIWPSKAILPIFMFSLALCTKPQWTPVLRTRV